MEWNPAILVVILLMLLLFALLGPFGREVIGLPLRVVDGAITEFVHPAGIAQDQVSDGGKECRSGFLCESGVCYRQVDRRRTSGDVAFGKGVCSAQLEPEDGCLVRLHFGVEGPVEC